MLDELSGGEPLAEALISGYSAFLCSGQFLYLQEPMGRDTDLSRLQYDVAARLSHFLGNTRPDSILMARAERGELLDADTLADETDRLIELASFENFVTDFTDYWPLVEGHPPATNRMPVSIPSIASTIT